MKINEILENILKENKKALKIVDRKKTKELLENILTSKNVFVTGVGRSGFVAECFAMRLMQSGVSTYFIGDCTTPAITKKDLLIAISGSGKTDITNMIIKKAKQKKAKTTLITNQQKIKRKEVNIIEINAKDKTKNNQKSIQPLGSLFEQACLLYLDALIVILMSEKKLNENKINKKHANLE